MKNKKVIIILLVVLLINAGCGQKETTSTRTERELLSLINNQKTKEELISKSLSIITREDIPPYGSTLEEVNNQYEIQCLRSVDDFLYAIFQSDKSGLLYLLFIKENEKYIVHDI